MLVMFEESLRSSPFINARKIRHVVKCAIAYFLLFSEVLPINFVS